MNFTRKLARSCLSLRIILDHIRSHKKWVYMGLVFAFLTLMTTIPSTSQIVHADHGDEDSHDSRFSAHGDASHDSRFSAHGDASHQDIFSQHPDSSSHMDIFSHKTHNTNHKNK